jgi:predicted metalloprotease with PDZ domain
MKNISLLLFLTLITTQLLGQTIHHKLTMPQPETHYFHVETTLSDFDEEAIVMSMPVWTPGSYLVREFAKNINRVRATDENGKDLLVQKIRKNKWMITSANAKKVTVKYEVYAFELTVRTSFLDRTHGYLNGTSVFMYPEGNMDMKGMLTVVPHKSFEKITTPLPKVADGEQSDNGTTYAFEDYDQLVDSPMEIGNQETFSFDAAGVKHHVAMYGPGNYNVNRLKKDMARIIEAATAVFGENPNKEYWFIIHNTNVGSGGLEHKTSTTLNVNRWTYDGREYTGFLSLVAHEYFHLWNVKRLRPKSLVDYDYDNENYTDLLWVMEGFTSYYDELILRRAGFYTEDQYLQRFKSTLNWVEGSVGNTVQPVAHASYDAWIKAYRPNENSRNTTISYYSKGSLVAVTIDAMIIESSKGKKSLDDFMQLLYKKFYKDENTGMTPTQFKETLEEFIGEDLDQFFKDYVYGTKTVPYNEYFDALGLTIDQVQEDRVALGASLMQSGGELIVRGVSSESPAEVGGLSPNDEIIAFNGFRVNETDLNQFINSLMVGDEFNLIISRDKQLMTLDLEMGLIKAPRYDFSFEQNGLGEFWLREQMK